LQLKCKKIKSNTTSHYSYYKLQEFVIYNSIVMQGVFNPSRGREAERQRGEGQRGRGAERHRGTEAGRFLSSSTAWFKE
jgi:hypothetical protein